LDQFTSNQDQRDQQPIIHVSSSVFHRWKCFILWYLCVTYLTYTLLTQYWKVVASLYLLGRLPLTLVNGGEDGQRSKGQCHWEPLALLDTNRQRQTTCHIVDSCPLARWSELGRKCKNCIALVMSHSVNFHCFLNLIVIII